MQSDPREASLLSAPLEEVDPELGRLLVWYCNGVKAGTVPTIDQFRNELHNAGRNDPCPCGSGVKFKKCCGRTNG